VQGQALVDERYLFSIIASKSYDGGLYFAQLNLIHKTITKAIPNPHNDIVHVIPGGVVDEVV
jgi:hypothetical protein